MLSTSNRNKELRSLKIFVVMGLVIAGCQQLIENGQASGEEPEASLGRFSSDFQVQKEFAGDFL